MRIVDLTRDESIVRQCAELLVDLMPEGWADMHEARQEMEDAFTPGQIARVGVEGDLVLGWVGGQERYSQHAWELHPLVVRRDRHRQGIGRALVLDLEDRVRGRGAHTIYLGADDDTGQTSLAGVDLYPDPLEHLRRIQNLAGHQYEFYQRLGYAIVGVVPDASGFGKPDTWMAKRIASREQEQRHRP